MSWLPSSYAKKLASANHQLSISSRSAVHTLPVPICTHQITFYQLHSPQSAVSGSDELGRKQELDGADEQAGQVETQGERAHGQRHLVHCDVLARAQEQLRAPRRGGCPHGHRGDLEEED